VVVLQPLAGTTGVFDVVRLEFPQPVVCNPVLQGYAGSALVVLLTLIHLVSWSY
jgi:hypothetical protein